MTGCVGACRSEMCLNDTYFKKKKKEKSVFNYVDSYKRRQLTKRILKMIVTDQRLLVAFVIDSITCSIMLCYLIV